MFLLSETALIRVRFRAISGALGWSSAMPRVRVLPADQSAEAEAETLLELCVDAKLPVPFGCTVGKCGVCRIEVVAGELGPASRFEAAVLEGFQCEPGVRLACQARLAGDVTVQPLSSARRSSSES